MIMVTISFKINVRQTSFYYPIYYLFLSVKDLPFLVFGLPQPLLLEVSIIQVLGKLHAWDVQLGGSGNTELLMGSTQRNSVQG